MKIVYVAGKFRGKNAWEVHKNVQEALKVAFEVASLGAMPLTPHANTFPFDGTLDDQFWLDGTTELLRRSDALMTVSNWTKSEGTKMEIHEAVTKLGIPVFHELAHLEEWLKTVNADAGKELVHVSVFDGEDSDVPAVMMCGEIINIDDNGVISPRGHDFFGLDFFGPMHGTESAIAAKVSEVTCPICRFRVQKVADDRFAQDERLDDFGEPKETP